MVKKKSLLLHYMIQELWRKALFVAPAVKAAILIAIIVGPAICKRDAYARDYSRQFDGLIEMLKESQQREQYLKELQAAFTRKFDNAFALLKKGDRAGGRRDLRIAAELNRSLYSRRSAELSRLDTAQAEELRAKFQVYHSDYQEVIESAISKYCRV